MSRVLLFALMLTATSMASFGQAAAPAKYPRVVTELHLISGRKPKHALLFAEQLIPRPTIEDYEFGNAGHKVECKGESQPDFACALVFNFDPPVPDGIASVSGSEYDLIRGIMLRLDGTLYTTVFDPPLKKENGFSGLEKGTGILARVNGDYLLVRWPNGKEAKAKIIRREKINPNRPQHA